MKYIKYNLKKIKNFLSMFIKMFFYKKKLIVNSQKKQVYILFGADYCNLGDIAITYAQEKFLKDNLDDDYEIVIINNDEVFEYYLSLKKNINSNSIITFIGGGNNGDLYDFIDFKRRFILKTIKKCKIISFPQTVVYSDTYEGKKKLNEFIKYSKYNKKFYICAREKKSLKKYLDYGLKNVFLVPDIVFSLDNYFEGNSRNGVGFILRDDCEKLLSSDFQESLIKDLKNRKINIEFMDTCGYDIDLKNYLVFFKKYIKKLLSKKLVITDRLHGMIFCYITNTPCIVFNNNNSKISSTYDTWLTKQNFILLCDENDKNIYNKVQSLLNLKEIVKENIYDNYNVLLKILDNNYYN